MYKISLDTGIRPDPYKREIKRYDKLTNGVKYVDISCKKGFIKKKIMQFKNLFAQFSQK